MLRRPYQADGSLEEGAGIVLAQVLDVDVGQPAGVVDGNVQVLSADAAAAAAVSGDAVDARFCRLR